MECLWRAQVDQLCPFVVHGPPQYQIVGIGERRKANAKFFFIGPSQRVDANEPG
jgi:hypothetical protein